MITHLHQDGTGGTVAGRWSGVRVGPSGDPDLHYAASYGYDGSGRLNHVTGPGLPAGGGTDNGAWYSRVSGSGLVEQALIRDSSAEVVAWTAWEYEPERDLVAAVENNLGDLATYATVSKYAYENDSRARRTSVVRTGVAFSGGSGDHLDLWSHDDRDELTGVARHAGTDPDSPGGEDADLRRMYAYDPVGNRTTSKAGDPNSAPLTTYTANNLNQYDPVQTATDPLTGQRLEHDLDGNLVEGFLFGDLDNDGVIGQGDLRVLLRAAGRRGGSERAGVGVRQRSVRHWTAAAPAAIESRTAAAPGCTRGTDPCARHARGSGRPHRGKTGFPRARE